MYEGLEDLKVDTVNRKTLAKQVIERIVHLLSSGQLRYRRQIADRNGTDGHFACQQTGATGSTQFT